MYRAWSWEGRHRTVLVGQAAQQLRRAARFVQEHRHRGPHPERPQDLGVLETGRVRGLVQTGEQRVGARRAQTGGAPAAEHRVIAQPPRGVGAYGLGRAVGQQHPHWLDQGVPQRRLGEQGERLRPGVVVHQIEIAYGDDLGGDRRDRRVRQPVEDVLAPDVHGVEQPRVVGFGEVAVTGLQFVRIEDDIGGAHQGEGGEHPARGERLFAPTSRQLPFHFGEFTLPNDRGEGRPGQDQLPRRGEFTVLVGQRERAEPGFVTGGEVGVAHQRQDGVGEFVGVEGVLVPDLPGVEGSGDRGPHLRSRQDGARGGGQRAQLFEQRVRGVRVGDLQAEAAEVTRRVGERQQDLPGADGGTAARERHREAGQPVGVHPGERVVEPVPPLGGAFSPGDALDGVAELEPSDLQRP